MSGRHTAQKILICAMSNSVTLSAEDRRLPLFASDNIFRRVLQSPEKMVSRFVSPGQVVADLGCRPGYLALPLARMVGPKGKVFAVGFDKKAIEKVRQRARDEGLEDVLDSRVSSAAEVDFIFDLSVDFVLAKGLLCCMMDHLGALRQIRRILKKGGRSYLSATRFAKKSDPRSVSREEWRGVLAGFRVVESGQSLFSRWAVVSGVNYEPPDRSEKKSSQIPSRLACAFK